MYTKYKYLFDNWLKYDSIILCFYLNFKNYIWKLIIYCNFKVGTNYKNDI